MGAENTPFLVSSFEILPDHLDVFCVYRIMLFCGDENELNFPLYEGRFLYFFLTDSS